MFGQKKQDPDLEYFTIYDAKVGFYRIPMTALNRFDMLRQIESLFQDPNQKSNELFTYAEDFQLFKIGDYSKKTGQISPHTPEHIANLHEIKTSVLHKIQAENQTMGIGTT